MSPALAAIVNQSERLQALAGTEDWSEMLRLARDRQQQLEHYFSEEPLPDSAEIIRAAMLPIQQADLVLAEQARSQRQHLLQESIDLRQRWQMSDFYQRVQSLPS